MINLNKTMKPFRFLPSLLLLLTAACLLISPLLVYCYNQDGHSAVDVPHNEHCETISQEENREHEPDHDCSYCMDIPVVSPAVPPDLSKERNTLLSDSAPSNVSPVKDFFFSSRLSSRRNARLLDGPPGLSSLRTVVLLL